MKKQGIFPGRFDSGHGIKRHNRFILPPKTENFIRLCNLCDKVATHYLWYSVTPFFVYLSHAKKD